LVFQGQGFEKSASSGVFSNAPVRVSGVFSVWIVDGVCSSRRMWGGLTFAAALALAGCGSAPVTRPGGPAPLPPRTEAVAPDYAQSATLHALGLVGTPYLYGGNTPESGFDCSGLIAYVYREAAGIRTPRTVAELSRWGQHVPRNEVRTGDLAVFTIKGRTNHAGVYVGRGRFVHAPSTGGTVRLDWLDRGYWAGQGLSFRRPE